MVALAPMVEHELAPATDFTDRQALYDALYDREDLLDQILTAIGDAKNATGYYDGQEPAERLWALVGDLVDAGFRVEP